MKAKIARLQNLTTRTEPATRSPLSITHDGIRIGGPAPSCVALLRPAQLHDVPAMMPMLNAYVEQGLLIPRTEEQVCRNIREFTVAVDADGVVGCGALRLYSAQLAEVGALAVHERAQGHGIGRAIVYSLLDEADQIGIARVFAMTLQESFFHKLGFHTVNIAEFPQKIATDCTGCARRATCAEIAVVRDLGENKNWRS